MRTLSDLKKNATLSERLLIEATTEAVCAELEADALRVAAVQTVGKDIDAIFKRHYPDANSFAFVAATELRAFVTDLAKYLSDQHT